MTPGPRGHERSDHPAPFDALPVSVRVQLAVFGPLLIGAIAGFLLSESEVGYWVIVTLATIGGVLAGLEHSSVRNGALRGVVGGACFGLGIIVAAAIAGNPPLVEAARPSALTIVVTTVAGVLLGACGGAIAARRTRR